MLLWTTNQHAEIFFTAISLDAHNNNIRNLAQNSASDYHLSPRILFSLMQRNNMYIIGLVIIRMFENIFFR